MLAFGNALSKHSSVDAENIFFGLGCDKHKIAVVMLDGCLLIWSEFCGLGAVLCSSLKTGDVLNPNIFQKRALCTIYYQMRNCRFFI